MFLAELYERGIPGFQTDTDDNSKPKWGESRKTKLTLRQIRKLRKMVDVRSYEAQENLKKIKAQYAAPPDAGPGPM